MNAFEEAFAFSFVMSVRRAWNNSAPSGRIFKKFYIYIKSDEKVQVLLKYDKNNGYFILRHKYIYDIALNSSSKGNVIDNS